MHLRRLLPLLGLVLAGCATLPHNRVPADALDDTDLVTELASLLCRVASDCGQLRLHLVDRRPPQAEIFPDGRLLLNLGLLLATRSESEIAFVLAHEHAHRRLRHTLARSADERMRVEIEADAAAVRTLAAAGFDTGAGRALLQRLLDESTAAAVAPDPQAVAQMRARIDALPAADEGTSAHAEADAAWSRRLAPYRSPAGSLRGDAPASPPSPSRPAGP